MKYSTAGSGKGFQTISYAPHFISTVVMCGATLYLSPSSGIINKFIEILGGDSKNFLQDPAMFKWVYVLSGIWQEMGWGSIIYFATLSGVDRSLLEAGRDRRSLQVAENLVCESAGIDADDSDPAGIKLWFPSERRL